MPPAIEHRALIVRIPLAKKRPDHFADDIADLLLEGAAFAGFDGAATSILILPLAPDLPLMNVVAGYDGFLSE